MTSEIRSGWVKAECVHYNKLYSYLSELFFESPRLRLALSGQHGRLVFRWIFMTEGRIARPTRPGRRFYISRSSGRHWHDDLIGRRHRVGMTVHQMLYHRRSVRFHQSGVRSVGQTTSQLIESLALFSLKSKMTRIKIITAFHKPRPYAISYGLKDTGLSSYIHHKINIYNTKLSCIILNESMRILYLHFQDIRFLFR